MKNAGSAHPPPPSLTGHGTFSSRSTEPLQTVQMVKEGGGGGGGVRAYFPALEEAAWRHFQSARPLVWNV